MFSQAKTAATTAPTSPATPIAAALAEAPPLLPPEALPVGFVEEEVLLSLELE